MGPSVDEAVRWEVVPIVQLAHLYETRPCSSRTSMRHAWRQRARGPVARVHRVRPGRGLSRVPGAVFRVEKGFRGRGKFAAPPGGTANPGYTSQTGGAHFRLFPFHHRIE